MHEMQEVKIDLPCSSKVRISADVGAVLVVEIIRPLTQYVSVIGTQKPATIDANVQNFEKGLSDSKRMKVTIAKAARNNVLRITIPERSAL